MGPSNLVIDGAGGSDRIVIDRSVGVGSRPARPARGLGPLAAPS
ncbi:hypothetical protein A7982_12275 [Minicystis rosea]|nr:hypothetical protein A7982_12275 [Minicystis rosea]